MVDPTYWTLHLLQLIRYTTLGSTIIRFRTRINNHKSRVNAHGNLNEDQRGKDELIYRHFNSDGHRGLEDMTIQLIDRVKGENELREKEGQWIYKLGTLAPHGLNDNDGFLRSKQKVARGNNIFLVAGV